MDTVLRSPDFLREVGVFQAGYHHDILPFLQLKAVPSPVWVYALRTGTTAIDLDPPHALLSAWYDVYGVARLPQLLHSVPHMADIVLCDAVAFGNVAVLETLNALDLLPIQTRHLCLAAAFGHVAVLRFFNHWPSGWTNSVMDYAAAYGQLEAVRWLHENRAEGSCVDAMNHAASGGHLSVVEFLHLNRLEGCDTHAMDLAASNGHLHVVQWLHVNRAEGCTIEALGEAAANGHLDVVKWLHLHLILVRFAPNAIVRAAQNGHLEVVLFLYDHHLDDERFSRAYAAMNAAANESKDDVVWALWQQTNAKRSDLLRRAKDAGHHAFIQWLRQVSVRQRASAMLNGDDVVLASSGSEVSAE